MVIRPEGNTMLRSFLLLLVLAWAGISFAQESQCWQNQGNNVIDCVTAESLSQAINNGITPEQVSEILFDANPDPILAQKRELIWICGWEAAQQVTTEEEAVQAAVDCFLQYAGPAVPEVSTEIPDACSRIVLRPTESGTYLEWPQPLTLIEYYFIHDYGWTGPVRWEPWIHGYDTLYIYQGLAVGDKIKYVFPECNIILEHLRTE